MYTFVTALDEMQEWIRRQLVEQHLQCPDQYDRLDEYGLVVPEVYADTIPPGSILPQSDRIRIPCVVVGFDEVRTEDEETIYQVMLTAAVYDPGHQTQGEERLQTAFNFDGYVTLLNLLDVLRAALIRDQVIGSTLKLESPITMKTYEEQPWPYWYGYLRFTLTGPAYPQTYYKL